LEQGSGGLFLWAASYRIYFTGFQSGAMDYFCFFDEALKQLPYGGVLSRGLSAAHMERQEPFLFLYPNKNDLRD
jgi:hypothetical protein